MTHQWNILFKKGNNVVITGGTFREAIIHSGLSPFLVIDVESITQTK